MGKDARLGLLQIGVVAEKQTLATGTVPSIVLATAHPAKFPDAMAAITGSRPIG